MPTARASRGAGQVAQGGELPSSGNLCEKRFDIIDKVLMIFKANAYAQDEIVCIPPPHRPVGLDGHWCDETACSAPRCSYRKCFEHIESRRDPMGQALFENDAKDT